MHSVSIIGCGFVADYYMRSFASFPQISISHAYDKDRNRCLRFCNHWAVKPARSLEEFLAARQPGDLVLNLTNPSAHFEITRACLEVGLHVYSEKPLATEMDDARRLHALAAERKLLLASAPCSVLGEAAQTLWAAVRDGIAGAPRLIYAELDDGFVPQAPYRKWLSESGAPWPHEDEFRVGCTVEHAGYYLTWLVTMFGPVTTVVAGSADLVPSKLAQGHTAPDFSVGVLFFESGCVARLTCSIIAPHDHRLRIFCDHGVLDVGEAWNNTSPVRFHRRTNIRRRQFYHPLARRLRIRRAARPRGGPRMNFALGPMEMLAALTENRPCRLSADFALHINEVTLAIQNARDGAGAQRMQTSCPPMDPMPWAVLS